MHETITNNVYVPLQKVRVLVVENDHRTRISHRVNLERFGYQVVMAEGIGDELLADAQRKVIDEACHIAVVDMRLYNDHDNADQSGLTLIPKLKPALTIVVSGSGNDRNTTKKALQQGAFDFIGKLDDLQYLQKSLNEAAKVMGVSGSRPEIKIRSASVEQVMISLAPGKPEQVHEIFCSLFPSAKTIIVQSIKAEARTPKVAHRQRSFVFRVYVDDLQPVIVKIAGIERITREAERYERYICNRVPGNFYAQKHQTMLRWQIGAVVYDFIGVDQSYLGLFRDYYKSASIPEIKKVLKHLFETTWGAIYRQTKQLKEFPLMVAYTEVWGHDWIERMIHVADGVSELFATAPDDLKLLNPFHWVLRRTSQTTKDESFLPQTYLAVTHGDLKGDNFFVDKDQQTWTIDYELTGPGPVFRDFTTLEVDIVVHLMEQTVQQGETFIELCLLLSAPNRSINIDKCTRQVWQDPAARKAYEVVKQIRQLAQQVDDLLDMRVYLWGLLLNLVNVYQAELDAATKTGNYALTRSMTFAAILCHRLDHWDDMDWPPPEWLAVQWLDKRQIDALSSRNEALRRNLTTQWSLYKSSPKDDLLQSIKLACTKLKQDGEPIPKEIADFIQQLES